MTLFETNALIWCALILKCFLRSVILGFATNDEYVFPLLKDCNVRNRAINISFVLCAYSSGALVGFIEHHREETE